MMTDTAPKQKAKRKPQLAKLTDKQAEVLCVIYDGCKADSLRRSPSLKNIAVAIGIAKSTAGQHVEALIKAGCVEGDPFTSFALDMTDLGTNTVEAWRKGK